MLCLWRVHFDTNGLFLQEEEQGWKMTPSNFLPTVVEGTKLYKGGWKMAA